MRRYACVYFPNWPIQRLIVAQPQLRRQQVVLFAEPAQRGQIVVAVSPAAQLAGVQIGLPLTEATALLRRSQKSRPSRAAHSGRDPSLRDPSLRDPSGAAKLMGGRESLESPWVGLHDVAADHQALLEVGRELQQFSPRVGVDQVIQPQALWLELTGVEHLFGDRPGSEWNLLGAAISFLRERGYWVQAAAADTPGQAWAVAHFGIDWKADPGKCSGGEAAAHSIELPSCAATHRPSPPARGSTNSPSRALRIVPPGTIWEPLDPLPPGALRLDSALCETLAQLGLERISQVRQLPRASLLARFGATIAWRLDQAAGRIPEVWRSLGEEPRFQAERSFDFPIRDRGSVEFVIGQLLEQVCRELRSLQQGALQWQITGRVETSAAERLSAEQLSACGTLELVVNLFQPTATVRHVQQLVGLQLEQQREWDLEARPLQELRVRATRCVLLAERQRQLFDEDPRMDGQAVAQLLNQLAARLGPDRIVRPVQVAGAQPELAFRQHVLVGNVQRVPRGGREKPHVPALSRPLRLLSSAWPLSVTARPPLHSPALLVASGWQATVARAWGPERIETGWWRGTLVRRDYWRVQTVEGQLLWLYRDLNRQQWFLQGTF